MNQTITQLPKHALRVVADLLYPPSCVLCHRDGAFLCRSCAAQLPQADGSRCNACWLPLSGESCWRCVARPLALTSLRSTWRYEGKVRHLVRDLKFRGYSCLAEPLAAELHETYVGHAPDADALIPVPLNAQRRRERGFDQSLLLAKHLGASTGLPVLAALERTRYDRAQSSGLTREQRLVNVEGAFRVRQPGEVIGGNILLIDDIATTGATLNACARELLTAGAASVSALTLARED